MLLIPFIFNRKYVIIILVTDIGDCCPFSAVERGFHILHSRRSWRYKLMKMRVLYSTGKKKLINIAQLITDKYATEKVNCLDKIPPAYSCDKERLVVILATVGSDAPNTLVLFCNELTKARCANVAFIIDGPESGAKVLIDAVREAGANAIEDVLYIKGGLPFLGGVKEEEKASVAAWMDKVSESLQ